MILDTRSLIILTFFQSLVMSGCLLITARKGYPQGVEKSMHVWGFAYLIQAAGWLLGGLRGIIPDFLSIVISNTLIVWSLSEIFRALRLFDEQKPHRKFSISLVVFVFVACLIFSNVQNNLLVRTVVVYSASFVFLMVSGIQLVYQRGNIPGKLRHILGSGFWLSAAISIIRIIYAFNPEASTNFFLVNTPIQTLVFGGTAIGGMIMSIGFLLMCTESFNNLLIRLAITDDLTGLFNHRGIEEMTQKEMERAERSRQPLAFLIMDADNFKTINDTYGHLAGDVALQVIADKIKLNLRSGEIIGRLGGDEFVVVLPNTPFDIASQIAERLSSAVNETCINFDGKKISLSISFGAALFSPGEPDFSRLVQMADSALYEMKRDNNRHTASMLAEPLQ